MAETRVLIVVSDPEAGKAYAKAISDTGAGCDIASSFVEMADMAVETPYNGLVIDILTLVRCSKDQKAIAYECINLFPVLRVKWDKNRKRINLSPLEQSFSPNPDSVLRLFIETRCRSFTARRIRRQKRKAMNLNVLLSADSSFPPELTVKAFTTNVSTEGVFLHTMRRFEEGQPLWIRFVELRDQTPVPAMVRWWLEWGVSRSIPGVGVMLGGLSPDQEREFGGIVNF